MAASTILSTSPPDIHSHSEPLLTVLPVLKHYIPNSLPLLRRLQSTLQTPHTHVLSTALPPLPSDPSSHPFISAFVDRSRAPETEYWIFSSVELYAADSPTYNSLAPTCKVQLLALLTHISTLPRAPTNQPIAAPENILIGALHSNNLSLLTSGETPLPTHKVVSGLSAQPPPPPISLPTNVEDRPDVHTINAGLLKAIGTLTHKYILPPTISFTPLISKPLPAGLTFTTVRRSELKLVLSRTDIPRREETLAVLGNVGVRLTTKSTATDLDDDTLVAWAFLGLDGSLSSLHVEEAYRGRGLAKAVVARLFDPLRTTAGAESVGLRGVGEGEGWAHSDVSAGNEGGIGVPKAVGGVWGWDVYWVVVDLGRCAAALEEAM